MKITTVIDPTCEEEIIVRLKEERPIASRIAELIERLDTVLLGYSEGRIERLLPKDLVCVTVDGGRVYAVTADGRFTLKKRLYEIEELLGEDFVKINQSCLVRIDAIKCFETTFGGSLCVRMKNGFGDYVSRRQLKHVKERMKI